MTAYPLSGRKILLVEDEYFIADDLTRAFKVFGAEIVGPAASIGDALGLIEKTERLDGALLDVNLRGEMAYLVADVLIARGVPLVFTTGYDKASVPERYAHIALWEKPVDPSDAVKSLFA